MSKGVAALAGLRLRLFARRSFTVYTRQSRVAALVRLGLIALIGIAFLACLVVGLTMLLRLIVSGPHGKAMLTPILTWGLAVTSLFVFFYGVLAVLAVFTYGSDLELLLLTPLSPRLILGDKFLTVTGGFFALLVLVGMPVLTALGHALQLGAQYYYAALLVLFLVPVGPVAVALIVTLAILRWLPPARARVATAIVGVALLVAFYLAGQLLRGHASDLPTSFSRMSGFWRFIPLSWPGHALAAVGLGQTATALLYLQALGALDACLVWLSLSLSSHMFSVGWAGYQEVGRRSRPGPARATSHADSPGLFPALWSAQTSRRFAFLPILGKEWLTLRRDPRVMGQIAAPLVLALFSLAHLLYRGGGVLAGLASVTHGTVGWFCGSLSFTALFLVSFLALSIVNREGPSLYLMALAPAGPRMIVLGKWLFCAAPALVLTEILLIVGAGQLGFTLFETIVAALAVASLVVALAGTYLLLGLVWPRLSRDGASQPVSPLGWFSGSIGGALLSTAWSALMIGGFALFRIVPLGGVTILGIAIALTWGVIALISALAPRLLFGLFVSDIRLR